MSVTFAIYYRDDSGSLTWLGGWTMLPGVTPAKAAQVVANAMLPGEPPAPDYHGRLEQMRRGVLAANWWRCGSREGRIPALDASGVEMVFGRDMRDAHLVGARSAGVAAGDDRADRWG